MTRPYQNLIAWKEAYQLALRIYTLTKLFPNDEKFGLTSQLRRASSSIAINLAEGNCRRSPKDKLHFFEIALSSLNEVHCECLFARDLTYISHEQFNETDKHIQKTSYLITNLRASLHH